MTVYFNANHISPIPFTHFNIKMMFYLTLTGTSQRYIQPNPEREREAPSQKSHAPLFGEFLVKCGFYVVKRRNDFQKAYLAC